MSDLPKDVQRIMYGCLEFKPRCLTQQLLYHTVVNKDLNNIVAKYYFLTLFKQFNRVSCIAKYHKSSHVMSYQRSS